MGLKKALYIVINDFLGKLYPSFFYRYTLVNFRDSTINMLFKIKFFSNIKPRMFLIRHSFNLIIVEAYSWMNLDLFFPRK